MFKKIFREVARPVRHVPVAGPLVFKVARETGRVVDNTVGATVGAVAVETLKQGGKLVGNVVGEITGSRKRNHKKVDEQNQIRKKEVLDFLNSRQEDDIKTLEKNMSDMLSAYSQARPEGSFDVVETIEIYKLWRMAIIEIETDQEPVNLKVILDGSPELLRNFLTEGEFLGGCNPLTLAFEKFITGKLKTDTMSTLFTKSFESLSQNSELFYLERDAKENTFAELLLHSLETRSGVFQVDEKNERLEEKTDCDRMMHTLLNQALKDLDFFLINKDEEALQKLASFKPVLETVGTDGKSGLNKIEEAGYGDIILLSSSQNRLRP